MNTIIIMQTNVGEAASTPGSIIIGAIVLLIMGYLVYSLIKPEKF